MLPTPARATDRPVLIGQSLGGARGAARGVDRARRRSRGCSCSAGRSSPPSSTRRSRGSSSSAEVTGFVATVLAADAAAPGRAGGRDHLRHRGGELRQQPADGRPAAPRPGSTSTWGEVRHGHTWTCWRDLLDPHLTDLLRRCGTLTWRRAPDRAGRARPRPARHGDPLRPLGPAGGGVPQRAGPGLGLREQRHGRRRRRPGRGRPGQALLRRLLRRRDLVRPRCRSRSAPTGTARTRPGSPTGWSRLIGARLARRRRRDRHRLQPRRLPRAQLRAHPRRPVPGRDLPVRQLRPVRVARLGRPRRRGVLHQPHRLRPAPARRPPRLAAQPAARRAGRRRGSVGDPPDRLAAARPADGRPARREAASRTSSTSGATTPPTTGRGGRARSPTTCRGSADGRGVGAGAGSGEDGGDVAGQRDDAQSGDRDQQGLSCPLEPPGRPVLCLPDRRPAHRLARRCSRRSRMP